MNVTLGLLLSGRMSSLYLPRRIVFKLLGDPVGSFTLFVFSETTSLIIDVSELAASKLDNVNRKVMADSVDVVG
jgi:glycerol uptake facilitator-like aquaporin